MREIKFRGKRIDNGDWVNGLLTHDCNEDNKDCLSISENWTEFYEVIPETVGQYTGLKDKNGVEIYEGDIVRWDDMTNGERWRVAVVEFNPDIQFRIIKIQSRFIQSAKEGYVFRFGKFAYKDTENHLEIIGNIHEK